MRNLLSNSILRLISLLRKCWKVYGGERRWLAGCLLLAGGAEPTFQLRPLNVFFTEKPDEEVNNDLKARIQTCFQPRCQTCVSRLLGSLRRVSLFTSHLFHVFSEASNKHCHLFRARMGRTVREGSTESCSSCEVWQDQLKLTGLLHQEVQEPRVLLCRSGVLKSNHLKF